MSAINTLVQRDRVHLLTDGAIYQPDGMLSAIGPKVRAMPHLSCAIAMRGAYLGFAPIMEELSAMPSFDVLRAGASEVLRSCASHYRHLLEQCAAGLDFEIVIAGVPATGPEAFMVASHDRHGTPWEVITMSGLSITPADTEIHDRMLDSLPNGCTADQVDPATDGLRILEIQRAGLERCVVGGFAQVTTVTADTVTSRIIHRWSEDVVGAKLGKR